jgi:diadenylate cyclase
MNDKQKLEEILSFVAPGTEIRKGLDNILDARTGGLIVVGDDDNVLEIVDGGFFINCEYNPQRIYELAKMDGAIILNSTTEKILFANIQLQPNPSVPTMESGTRHRTAERTAKQTGKLVIAISEKRNRITLYKNNVRYVLRNMSDIMSEASQAMKTLERYREVIDKALTNLTIMEYDDLVTLFEVSSVLQKYEFLARISKDIEMNIIELGSEGTLISLQLDELMYEVKGEIEDLIRDYHKENEADKFSTDEIFEELSKLSEEKLMELENVVHLLGYRKSYSSLDTRVVPKGYRILGKIIRLTQKDVEILVSSFKGLNAIMDATLDELAKIDNISKFKARTIKNGIRRLRFTTQLEKS